MNSGARADGGLEILGVALGRAWIAHGDGRVARRRPPPRAARIAEDPRGHLGKIRQVAIRERMALSAEAAQPVLHVGGVARLAHLAVVDEIDAGLDLTTHHRGHRGPDAGVERGGIHRHALLLGVHRADEIGRARQTPGVRREEPLGAVRERHGPAQAAGANIGTGGPSSVALKTTRTACPIRIAFEIAVHDVGHHRRPLGQRHVGDGVRDRRAPEDAVGVDRPPPRGLRPLRAVAAAEGTDGARIVMTLAARGAALDQQLAGRPPRPRRAWSRD